MIPVHLTRRYGYPTIFGLAVVLSVAGNPALAETAAPLELAQTISLPDVRGRIDHLAIDIEGERLFIAALGNNTLEVVDLRAGKRTERVSGLREPQGVLYVPDQQRLWVATGEGARVDVFTGSPLRHVARVEGLDDADNVRYDAGKGIVYVGFGSGIAIVVAGTAQLLGKIDLPAHPESFQLESAGTRMFVNVPRARRIAVLDRSKREVIGTWALDDVAANFPMALDEQDHRLFVATRRPAALLAYDTQTGKRVANLAIGGDADDLFYDPRRKRLYVICGDGVIDVVQKRDADHYELLRRVHTAPGARTGLFVPARDTLYVAVPARGVSSAEIRAYTAH